MANNPQILIAEASKGETDQSIAVDFSDYRELACLLRVTNVSGTSPTLDVTIQHSYDNTNWITLKAFAQKTAVGTEFFNIPDGSSVWGFSRYIRASYVIGGTTPLFSFEVTVVGKE